MANFPTSLDSLTNPTANDTLAAVPHHTQHGTANDILEALEAKVGIGSSTPAQGKVLRSSATGSSAWVSVSHQNVMDHGAVADDSTDNTAAFAAAITAARASGQRAIYIPAGTYKFAAASDDLDLGDGDFEVFGDGMNATILHYDEGTGGTTRALFSDAEAPTTSYLNGHRTIRDLQIRGTWNASKSQRGLPAIYMTNVESLTVSRVRFYDLASQAISLRGGGRISVTGCEFDQVAIDCVFTRGVFSQIISGNHVKHTDDNPFGLHQGSVELTATGIPREGIVVTDNILEDTCGMAVLGGRMVTITGNIFVRWKHEAIVVYPDTTEGDNVMAHITVADNQLFDGVAWFAQGNTFPSVAISVRGATPTQEADTSNVVPGEPNTSTGAFVRPFAYRANRTGATGQSMTPMHGADIRGNRIVRTLPAVAGYSDWGYGEQFSRDGWRDDAVTDANMRVDQAIVTQADGRDFRIRDNTVAYCGTAITLGTASRHFAGDCSIVSGNILSDFQNYGVLVAGAYSMHLDISGNVFNGDPYHDHANRASAGKWTANLNGPTAVHNPNTDGFTFEQNTVKNVCNVLRSETLVNIKGNRLYCNLDTAGFHANNAGIGNIPASGTGYTHLTITADPTNASFGDVSAIS